MQIGSVTTDDLVQAVTFIACLIFIATWFYWGRRRLGYIVLPVSFLIHRAIYYVAILLDSTLTNAQIVMWSSAISLQSVITVGAASLIMIAVGRRGNRS